MYVFLPLAILIGLATILYVPSFIEAQPRVKATRTRHQLRMIDEEIQQKLNSGEAFSKNLEDMISVDNLQDPYAKDHIRLLAKKDNDGIRYFLISAGPNEKYDYHEETASESTEAGIIMVEYDATNGTLSGGDIIRELTLGKKDQK